MKHLTVDEMINFVSLTELNAEALMLSATVNEHIRNCDKCLKRVQAFQLIYDEFAKLQGSGDFKNFILSKLQSTQTQPVAEETQSLQDELDGYA